MIYIGMDPGKTTGLAISEDNICTWLGFVDDVSVKDNSTNLKWLINKIINIIEENVPTTIIIEEYRVYPGQSSNQALQEMWAPEIIGAISYIIYKYQSKGYDVQIYRQWASLAKNYCTNQMLKDRGFYTVPYFKELDKNDKKLFNHARDAARHILYYIDNIKK